MTDLIEARFPEHLELVRELFTEYVDSLNIDLAFQDVQSEFASLPGKYAAPAGRVILAIDNGVALGCVAMRAIDATTAEMKRLYVRPQGRGQQLGRKLAERICQFAREAGYQRIRLDTLPSMAAAQDLYRALGFRAIEPYVFNPIAGTRYMELHISDPTR